MNIDSEVMRAAVTKAILDSMGVEGQQALLTQAVQSLMEKDDPRDHYSKTTKIQRIFADSAYKVAREIVSEQLESSPEFREKLKEVVEKSIADFFSEAMKEKISAAIQTALVRSF